MYAPHPTKANDACIYETVFFVVTEEGMYKLADPRSWIIPIPLNYTC